MDAKNWRYTSEPRRVRWLKMPPADERASKNFGMLCRDNDNVKKQQSIKMADVDLGLLDDDDYIKSVLRTKRLGIAECFIYRLPSGSKAPYRYAADVFPVETRF